MRRERERHSSCTRSNRLSPSSRARKPLLWGAPAMGAVPLSAGAATSLPGASSDQTGAAIHVMFSANGAPDQGDFHAVYTETGAKHTRNDPRAKLTSITHARSSSAVVCASRGRHIEGKGPSCARAECLTLCTGAPRERERSRQANRRSGGEPEHRLDPPHGRPGDVHASRL